jgi:hypothetical protein
MLLNNRHILTAFFRILKQKIHPSKLGVKTCFSPLKLHFFALKIKKIQAKISVDYLKHQLKKQNNNILAINERIIIKLVIIKMIKEVSLLKACFLKEY